MEHTSRHYGYYKDALETWSEFPDWLNQKYYNKCVNTTDQDLMLLRARVQITGDIITKFSQNNPISYSYNIPKSMILKNIMTLTWELTERFYDVKLNVPNTGSSKFISINEYDPLTQRRPNSLRINFA